MFSFSHVPSLGGVAVYLFLFGVAFLLLLCVVVLVSSLLLGGAAWSPPPLTFSARHLKRKLTQKSP